MKERKEKMRILEGLAPERVFYYFEEICGIPHGSGNIEKISDYLMDFAKEKGLFAKQDELKNVIIVKPATAGYEEEPAVILQGHMDMVAVKKPDCAVDMAKEGLKLAVTGDKIYATRVLGETTASLLLTRLRFWRLKTFRTPNWRW